MRKVLFVCTANICRSPMAAGIFDALAGDMGLGFGSESAGVAALVGEPAAPDAVRAMDELGIDIGGHRARQVDEAMVRDADLVLAMTTQHKETLHRNFGGSWKKIQTLPERSIGDAVAGIADPYGYGFSVYRTSAREILRHVELLLEGLGSERSPTGT